MAPVASPLRPARLLTDITAQAPLLSTLLTRQAGPLALTRDLLARAGLVRLLGIGSSRHVAGYGAACLDLLGGPPTSVLSAPGAGEAPPRFGPGQLLVVISQSGRTPALLPVAEAARAAGATVLAVTNDDGSPLEDLADVVLPVAAGPEGVIPATKSVTGSMLLLRALAGPVDPGCLGRLAATVGAFVEAAPAADGALPGAVVSGGVAGQWIADEVALKLAETAGHWAVSESLVDFLHGPAAVSGPVLAFVEPDDLNARALDGRPGVVTVGPAPAALVVDACGDRSLDPIARVVAGQCLALRWAQAIGVDPDDPRGLHKVTMSR